MNEKPKAAFDKEKTLVTDYWENVGEVKFYHHSLHEFRDD